MNIFENIKKAHFIGIGGIGISALAKLMIERGIEVSGSDLEESFITDDIKKRGGTIHLSQKPEHVSNDIDIVIYSDAVPETNPERLKAKSLNIEEVSYFAFLGRISKDRNTVAIAGNKGKTTTTAMFGLILQGTQQDPTVVVGSYVKEWGSNLLSGGDALFVVEACEYKEHFLHLHPNHLIITNIEPDHLDYFGTFENEIQAFERMMNRVPEDGFVYLNSDDQVSAAKHSSPRASVITYGIHNKADVMAHDISFTDGHMHFDVHAYGNDYGQIRMPVPGEFNVYNALAAIAVALKLGVPFPDIQEALSEFRGTWRRFEILGQYNGCTIISDYAHHPTAVKGAIGAAKQMYPDKKVIVAFHPHHHQRTKDLFSDFVKAFDNADEILMNEIFTVAGRDANEAGVNSHDLIAAIHERDHEHSRKRNIVYSKDIDDMHELLKEYARPDAVLLVMGAGDIYKSAEKLFS